MKKIVLFSLLVLMLVISGCDEKKKESRDIVKEFEGKNTLICSTTSTNKDGKKKTTKYIYVYDSDDKFIIDKVGFEESVYVSSTVFEEKPFDKNIDWYKEQYCMFKEDCDIEKTNDNRVRTAGTFDISNLTQQFFKYTKAEFKEALEAGTIDFNAEPYTCE